MQRLPYMALLRRPTQVIALTVAELVLSGIESAICADQVISAMKNVGCMMHESLRETSQGGLAATKRAREIEQELRRK